MRHEMQVARRYVVYHLGVHSQVPLWGVGDAECPADIHVRWETTDAAGASSPSPAGSAPVEDDQRIELEWPEVGAMSIVGGTDIVVRAPADAEQAHLRHLVSGIGLGLALYQRGVFALHASAVSIGGRAVAFAGPKGAGKSTLVAALTARGHELLSDDVVALDFVDDAPPLVRVGAPNFNLWPDSAEAIGHDPGLLSQIWSRSPKRAGLSAAAQPAAPVPLGAIVMLERGGTALEVEPLSPLDALGLLVGHTHAFRWIKAAPDLPRHLEQCRRVLSHVPVYSLDRGTDLGSLGELVERVEAMMEAPGAPCIRVAGSAAAAGAGA